jgi:hypothetical protein
MKTLRSAATGLLVTVLGLPAVLPAAENAAAPKTHVLYMGTDLSVQREGKLYRVEDVTGSTLMIRVGQEEVFVPTRNGPLGFQVTPGLKLSDASVTLASLKSGPAYTWENDPARKVKEAADNALNLQYVADIADTNLTRDVHNVEAAQDVLAHSAGPEDRAYNQAALERAESTARDSQRMVTSVGSAALGDMGNVGAGAAQAQAMEGKYDAMEVAFSISSPVELTNAFMVILYSFHDPAAKPGVDGMVIHVQALDAIDAKPRYVRVLKGGLPLGYSFVSCAVHIYSRGREVATNVSDKRVELTRDETRQYIVMEHIGGHKGATLAAAAVRGTLPRPRRESLSHDQLTRIIYVKVSSDGLPLGIFTNEACELQIDDSGTTAAVEDTLFRPALQKGKAVEGVARVRLADL